MLRGFSILMPVSDRSTKAFVHNLTTRDGEPCPSPLLPELLDASGRWVDRAKAAQCSWTARPVQDIRRMSGPVEGFYVPTCESAGCVPQSSDGRFVCGAELFAPEGWDTGIHGEGTQV